MKFLADVNFWLALAFDFHAAHPVAKIWFEAHATEGICFCRLTQQAFLRLASNPRVMKLDAVSLIEAWKLYDTILKDRRVTFEDEPVGIEKQWRADTQLATLSTNVWSDALLAAFAHTADLEVVTFDRGFIQYRDLKCTILKST